MALTTCTGQSAADDAAQLTYHAHWWQYWEQNGLSTQAGQPDYSNDPAGHYTWRLARSTTNKSK